MCKDARSEQLDVAILDSLADLIGQIAAHGERIAQQYSFPGFFAGACTVTRLS